MYSCRPCSVTQPSAWRELLYIELRSGVEKVLACLLSSTLTQHLVTCSQVRHLALFLPCQKYICKKAVSSSILGLSIVVTNMKLRTSFTTALCRNPGNPKGFSYFFLQLYVGLETLQNGSNRNHKIQCAHTLLC